MTDCSKGSECAPDERADRRAHDWPAPSDPTCRSAAASGRSHLRLAYAALGIPQLERQSFSPGLRARTTLSSAPTSATGWPRSPTYDVADLHAPVRRAVRIHADDHGPGHDRDVDRQQPERGARRAIADRACRSPRRWCPGRSSRISITSGVPHARRHERHHHARPVEHRHGRDALHAERVGELGRGLAAHLHAASACAAPAGLPSASTASQLAGSWFDLSSLSALIRRRRESLTVDDARSARSTLTRMSRSRLAPRRWPTAPRTPA